MNGPLGELTAPFSRQMLLIAAGRLQTLKALLPEDELLESKYVAEFHMIIDFMERGAVLNLSRFRMTSRHRAELRINILALLSVCEYQSRAPVLPNWQPLPRPRASRRSWPNVH